MSSQPRRAFILTPDDYTAGGLQRSAMAVRELLASRGYDARIYCVRPAPHGFASQSDYVRLVSRTHGNKLRRWAGFFRDLRKLFVNDRPEVFIAFGLATSIFTVILSIGVSGVRLAGSERIHPPMERRHLFWDMLRRFAYRRLDWVVCQTDETREWYIAELGIDPDRLRVIPNVIDPALAVLPSLAPQLDRFGNAPLIASIGRLEMQKGHDFALKIFAGISARLPEARFLIVGEGPREHELKAETEASGLSDKVMFLPKVSHLAEIWPRVDVFLLPSRYEGFPNVLGEAMAYGVPSVAFNCMTGPSDLITDGFDGFLVDVGDCAAAARACLKLLKDPKLRERIGRNATNVSNRFSRQRIGDLWLRLLSS